MRRLTLLFLILICVPCGAASWKLTGLKGTCCSRFTFHPVDPKIIYGISIPESDIYRSKNGGLSWLRLHVPEIGIIAIAPSEPNSLYLLSHTKFFKSVDSGNTWTAIGTAPTADTFNELEFDPHTSSVAYVAARNSTTNTGFLFKTANQGRTWSVLRTGKVGFHDVEVSPTNSSLIYARSNRYLDKSTDGGKSWITLDSPNGEYGFEMDPNDPNILYAGAGDLFRSVDGGMTWNGLGCACNVSSISIDSHNTNHIYVAAIQKALQTTDGGSSWIQMDLPNITQVAFPQTIAVSSVDPHLVLIGLGIESMAFRSNDGGVNWKIVSKGGAGTVTGIQPIAGSGSAFLANAGTIFGTTNRGVVWEERNSQLPDQRFFRVDSMITHPNVPGLTALLGTVLGVSIDAGKTWNIQTAPIGIQSIAFSLNSSNTLYAAIRGKGFTHSQDLGRTWTYSNRGLKRLLVNKITATSRILYLSNEYGEVFTSEDEGSTWKNRSNGLPARNVPQVGFAFLVPDPADSNTVYAGVVNKGLYKTTDAGNQWKLIRSYSDPTFARFLTVDPQDAKTLFLGISNYTTQKTSLDFSQDGGLTWNPYNLKGLPVNDLGPYPFEIRDLAIHPLQPRFLYLATDRGVYRSLR